MSDQQPQGGGPRLEFPNEDWGGFFKKHFGPSMLWALLGIGGSHIVRRHLPRRFQPGSAARAYYYVGIAIVVLFGVVGALGRLGLVG